jgi:hypothetical protein
MGKRLIHFNLLFWKIIPEIRNANEEPARINPADLVESLFKKMPATNAVPSIKT